MDILFYRWYLKDEIVRSRSYLQKDGIVKKFKILHCADLGLRNLPYGGINPETGLNRRFEDVMNNFKFIVSQAIKDGVEYFVIAGDINEERNPDSILIEKFSGFVADLISKEIKVIIIAGNHDVDSSKGTSTSISYLKELGLVNTFIADIEPERFDFEDVVFHCIPTMYPSQYGMETNEEMTEYINKYVNDIILEKDKYNILVAHYSLETTFEGLDVDETVLYAKNLAKFDYVALGHIHKYEMSKIFTGGFSGSLFVKDFGEQKDKYVNIVEFASGESKIDKIAVPEREFEQFNIDCIGLDAEDVLKKVEETVNNVREKIIKLRIKARKRINPKLIYDYLRTQKVFHYTPIEWDIVVEKEEGRTLEIKTGMTDQDVVKDYLDKNDYADSVKEELSSYINGVIVKCESSVAL